MSPNYLDLATPGRVGNVPVFLLETPVLMIQAAFGKQPHVKHIEQHLGKQGAMRLTVVVEQHTTDIHDLAGKTAKEAADRYPGFPFELVVATPDELKAAQPEGD